MDIPGIKDPYENIGDAFSECLLADLRLRFPDQFNQAADFNNWFDNFLDWHSGLAVDDTRDTHVEQYRPHQQAFTLPRLDEVQPHEYTHELQRATAHFQSLCEGSSCSAEEIAVIAHAALENLAEYVGSAWQGEQAILLKYQQELAQLAVTRTIR